jgi:flagellar motor switch protein FliN/FliY
MREFTTEEIDSIVKTMQTSQRDLDDQKIPLRETTLQGPISRVEFSQLREEKTTPMRLKPSLDHLKVHIDVLYGSTNLTLKELSSLQSGQVIALDEETSSTLTILANGKKIARGEVVTLDGHFGIKITEFEEKVNL